VLGVSGGKDSLRQAEFCRHVLGVEPILVSVGLPPSQTSATGVVNIKNLYDRGYEVLTAYPAAETLKRLTKHCFFNLGNLKVASEVALFNGAARMADLAQADIILWGENPAYSVGDAGSAGSSYFDGASIYQINTLTQSKSLPQEIVELNDFFYGIQDGLRRVAPKIVFMGAVIPKWSNLSNGLFSLLNGFSARYETNADYLNISAVDEDFVLINQYIKYLKFGFGRTTDILNELIRDNILTRSEALELLTEYEPYIPESEVERFARFISVKETRVWTEIYNNINSDLFEFHQGHPVAKPNLLNAQ
tara:strand:+ start:9579 stop:10496 length:918 start_codon:yes stop_codon:yes gene_type:complete